MFLGYKMSLLKWQEMAKSKSALGKKSTLFTMLSPRKGWVKKQVKLDLKKMFKPVTSKLDECDGAGAFGFGCVEFATPQKQPARRKKANLEGIDYFPTSIHLKI